MPDEDQITHPLSQAEKAVFGEDARRHPITGYPLERGSGCLSDDAQARGHLAQIAATQGKAAAEAMLIRLEAEKRRIEILTGKGN
jgi:hypothetical protein